MTILLDTHALLWWLAGGERLSSTARRALAAADTLLVSPISCWEVAVLAAKGRISLDRDIHAWVRDLFAHEQVQAAALTPQATTDAGLLPVEGFPGDPADCLLYATARELAVPLVTKDDRILEHARASKAVRVVW